MTKTDIQVGFRPLSGNEFKNFKLKTRGDFGIHFSFRPLSGNEFKNHRHKMNPKEKVEKVVFVPFRGMSLKTI